MQVLYVAEFEVGAAATAPPGVDPAQRCLEHLGTWIGGHTDPPLRADQLIEDGGVELSLAYGACRRHAAWEFVSGDDAWATRVERRDVSPDDSQFVTRVTVGDGTTGASVRVSMARESVTAGLTPAPSPVLRQPTLVSTLTEDPVLTVKVDGQVQDGRFLQVRSPGEVDVLAQVLKKNNRLPILLLHTRTLEAQTNAMKVASKLIGLVRVVTLDYRASRALLDLVPGLIDLPYSGGLLVWADMGAPSAVISAAEVNSTNPEPLRSYLMARIAPLSVVTRGFDVAYRHARQAAQATQTRLAAERTAAAASSGSKDEQLAALQAELEEAKAETAFAFEEAQKADDAKDEYKAEVLRLRAQVDQLAIASAFWPTAGDEPEPETLENAPKLEVGDPESLEALSQHLERVTQGHITFTPAASAAWRKADRYVTPEEMRTCLIKLAKVANDTQDGQDRVRGHFDTWVRENYDLRISMQDDTMPKGFRWFMWEGERYNRTPHVKVNDGVQPYECGRIYFTPDKTNNRIIVSHVGLHW